MDADSPPGKPKNKENLLAHVAHRRKLLRTFQLLFALKIQELRAVSFIHDQSLGNAGSRIGGLAAA